MDFHQNYRSIKNYEKLYVLGHIGDLIRFAEFQRQENIKEFLISIASSMPSRFLLCKKWIDLESFFTSQIGPKGWKRVEKVQWKITSISRFFLISNYNGCLLSFLCVKWFQKYKFSIFFPSNEKGSPWNPSNIMIWIDYLGPGFERYVCSNQ